MPQLILYTDATPKYAGFILKIGHATHQSPSIPLEEGTTVNQAEYRALIYGLEFTLGWVSSFGKPCEIVVKSDSELLVNQMRGRYRVKNIELKALHATASQLMSSFLAKGHTTWIEWVPGITNLADGISRPKKGKHERKNRSRT